MGSRLHFFQPRVTRYECNRNRDSGSQVNTIKTFEQFSHSSITTVFVFYIALAILNTHRSKISEHYGHFGITRPVIYQASRLNYPLHPDTLIETRNPCSSTSSPLRSVRPSTERAFRFFRKKDRITRYSLRRRHRIQRNQACISNSPQLNERPRAENVQGPYLPVHSGGRGKIRPTLEEGSPQTSEGAVQRRAGRVWAEDAALKAPSALIQSESSNPTLVDGCSKACDSSSNCMVLWPAYVLAGRARVDSHTISTL